MAKAPKSFQPSVVISNDLATGLVVFRGDDGAWVPDVARAEIAETREAADALLVYARADHDACKVIEPTLIGVLRENGFVRPAELRELIRATGPTIPLPDASSAKAGTRFANGNADDQAAHSDRG